MAPDLHLGADGATTPWSTLGELTRLVDPNHWVLIGGLMVEIHARAAGVVRERATSDVDVVIDLAAQHVTSNGIAGALYGAGFQLDERYRSAFRFRRGFEVIDVLIPSGRSARLRRRPMVPARAGAQALVRRETWNISDEEDDPFAVGVPSMLGALVLKAAAYQADSRDRERHLQDTAALLACQPVVSSMGLDQISTADRRRLKLVTDLLDDATHPAWLDVHASHRLAAHSVLQRIRIAAQL